MKKTAQTLLALLITMCVFSQNENTVNAIIGDISFVECFAQLPNKNTDEILRLQSIPPSNTVLSSITAIGSLGAKS